MISSQPFNLSSAQPSPLVHSIRDQIRREGPISFARFMGEALYHPVHGYYGSGRCAIGRRGDYFTSVSVGPLFGNMLAEQFAEIWRGLGRPDDFVIVEQGAHHGEFATDVLEALRDRNPELFATLRYRVVEPFPVLQQRQQGVLRQFAGKTEWCGSLDRMAPFTGVHFSNELIDAMPVHLLAAGGAAGERQWRERLVERTSCGFAFVERPVTGDQLRARFAKIPPAPAADYETELNLAMLDWIDLVAAKLVRGVVLTADYGFTRSEYYAPGRTTGTLQCYADHRVLPSPLEDVGEGDLTTHVEWTSLAERAEECGLQIAGFADQNHFLTGLLSSYPELSSAVAEKSRALQTLIHPEFLGMKFQFLALTKHYEDSLGGFRLAREPRASLGVAARAA